MCYLASLKSFTYSMILGDILNILILWDPFGKPYLYEKVISINNGNRTEWSPVWSVIIRVISKIGWPRSGSLICLIKSIIILQTELDNTKFCYQLIVTIKIFDGLAFFLTIKTQEIPRVFSLAVKKKSHLSACMRWCILSYYIGMMRTSVLLHCPECWNQDSW